ncbi:MAG: NADPH-dependent assimilatory sulfite reductase hemoprotein subunit, partial [Arenimonas sp.]
EPVYGPTYLPRKFKIGIAVPPINDVDVFSQDLGFIAIIENGELIGYNLLAGGGMGSTHGDARTYPRLADVLGFIRPEQLIPAAEAVLTTQRDFGNRSDRKLSRLKYTIDKHGLEWFIEEIERRLGETLPPARDYIFEHSGDRFGWTQGFDGLWHLTLRVESGRIVDTEKQKALSGLREIAKIHQGDFRLTPNQNLIVASVAAGNRAVIDALVAVYGLDNYQKSSALRLYALACVAFPTCTLAMAEAERYLPSFLDRAEVILKKYSLEQAPILLRISGCPNGCSRPYLGEIALVGKALGRYNLHLGADSQGRRLNRLYKENIDEAGILETLEPLLRDYAAQRLDYEAFGDYLFRSGVLPGPKTIDMELVS